MIFLSGRTGKMSDSQLLESYLGAGRLDHLGELYGRYMPLVYGLCLKYLKRAEEAEDAVMQIFEDLLSKVERSQVREFRTWIYTVSKNHCLQLLRKQKREVSDDYTLGLVESDDVLHLLNKKADEALYSILEECIEKLPGTQRESIRLFFMEDKSYADIVVTTGYHLKSVKSYIQNGKRNLKNCIEAKQARS